MIKRADYIDVGEGIMILWMITIHVLLSTYRLDSFAISELSLNITTLKNGWGVYLPKPPTVLFPYLHFIMPWFFYKSGQFFSKRDSYSLLVKDWKKLLTPFLLWSFVGYVFFVVFCCMDGSFSIRKVTLDVLLGAVIPYTLWIILGLYIVFLPLFCYVSRMITLRKQPSAPCNE